MLGYLWEYSTRNMWRTCSFGLKFFILSKIESKCNTYLSFTGKVTSLVAKKDLVLATKIEEAMMKNESLESLTIDSVRRDNARARITEQKGKSAKLIQVAKQKGMTNAGSAKSGVKPKKATISSKFSKPAFRASKSSKPAIRASKSAKVKPFGESSPKKASNKGSKSFKVGKTTTSKLNVVGFRGRSSWSGKRGSSVSS